MRRRVTFEANLHGRIHEWFARGDWLIAPGDSGLVFSGDVERVWRELIRKGDGRWVRAPGHVLRVSAAPTAR